MKPWSRFAVGLVLVGALMSASTRAGEQDFGDARFLAYQGKQLDWPKAESTQVSSDFAVPIYLNLPGVRYQVLGRIHDPRTSPFGIVGRALAEGLFAERERRRDCAKLAKARGGNAIVVTDHETFLGAFGVSRDEIAKTAPLFDHKDKLVLVVKLLVTR